MKKRRICILIIILLLIISLLLMIVIKNKKQNQDVNKQYIYPGNTTELHFSYKGKVNLTDVYARLYDVATEYIPEVYKQKGKLTSDKKAQKYYSKNKNINKNMNSADDFNKLLSFCKKNSVEKLELEHFEIVKSSCNFQSDKTEFKLLVKYKDCEELVLKITVLNNEESDSYLKFVPIDE